MLRFLTKMSPWLAITLGIVFHVYLLWIWRHDNIYHYQCTQTAISCCYKGNAYSVCLARNEECPLEFCKWKKRTWAYISGVSER